MFTMSEHPAKCRNERLLSLTKQGILSKEDLFTAEVTAHVRGIDLEKILIREYRIPRRIVLKTLSEYYNIPSVEYDEKIPVPPELFNRLDAKKLLSSLWFPVFKDKDIVVIAVNEPDNSTMLAEVMEVFPDNECSFMVALCEDIRWFVQDFIRTTSGHLVGVERTGLAYWRNTMAHWRTMLACYRTDFAKGRTGLNIMRWGLGLMVLADSLMRTHASGEHSVVYWLILAVGLLVAIAGLLVYLKIRKSRMRPPTQYTLVEVTGAVISFLEDFHYLEIDKSISSKKTMLARLGDLLLSYSTILPSFPAYNERIHLARERNVLAAQRTVAACYRTIVARARTGLSFIRSGVALASLGIGLIRYFGFSPLTIFDALLALGGVLMIIDGLLWYWPVRKENAETPRCYVQP
ncbi:MAG: hypothetical protein ACLPN1_09100 [Dissulfurispiraceae bacterium]|jgi:uncharacterized membrane protein YidH (DUF202 family)